MTVFINSMLSSSIDSTSLLESFQVVSVFVLLGLLVTKLLSKASSRKSRYAQVLNRAVNVPLVSLLMVFSIITFLRVILLIEQ